MGNVEEEEDLCWVIVDQLVTAAKALSLKMWTISPNGRIDQNVQIYQSCPILVTWTYQDTDKFNDIYHYTVVTVLVANFDGNVEIHLICLFYWENLNSAKVIF